MLREAVLWGSVSSSPLHSAKALEHGHLGGGNAARSYTSTASATWNQFQL